MLYYLPTIILILGLFLFVAGAASEEVFSTITGLIMFTGMGLALSTDGFIPPTALDVYRGKTMIEVTSVNGIPRDTVVVFKKE